MKSQHHESGYFLLGTLIGAGLGAAVALLMAPKPGRELRDTVGRKTAELKGRAEDLGLSEKVSLLRAGARRLGERLEELDHTDGVAAANQNESGEASQPLERQPESIPVGSRA
jgi:gas vesicle protein